MALGIRTCLYCLGSGVVAAFVDTIVRPARRWDQGRVTGPFTAVNRERDIELIA
jgi:hypothetical protein